MKPWIEYDEPAVLTDYVWTHCRAQMTQAERAAQMVLLVNTKAESVVSERTRAMMLGRWGSQNDPAVIAALAKGEAAFRIAVRDRVLRDHPEVVKRCPECHRVLRTPRAKQCRWCLHSWHARRE